MDVNLKWEAPVQALEKWNKSIVAKATGGENVINIYDTIGYDSYFDVGIGAEMVSKRLDEADGADVVVNINSPGGDFFEGLAIHTLLKNYDGNVKINVVGLAASAASVIAMASEDLNIAEEGFLMIHNAWTVAIGNRHAMIEASELLVKFDESMRDLYAKKTGIDASVVAKMMDDETWLSGKESVEQGFALALIGAEEIEESEESEQARALRIADTTLAKGGMPRSERRKLIKELTNKPSAVEDTPSAVSKETLVEALLALKSEL